MNVGAIVAVAAAGCVVLGSFFRAVHAIYKWCRRLGDAMDKVADRSAQLVPNGGSSMRDDVAAIRKHLAQQDAAIAELQEDRRRRRWRP